MIADAAWRHVGSPVEELRDLLRIDFEAVESWFRRTSSGDPPAPDAGRRAALVAPRAGAGRRRGDRRLDPPVLLFETGLPTRYHLPKTDVRMDLAPTDSRTGVPYRGFARYWNVVGATRSTRTGVELPDPAARGAARRRLVCFYNERVDLEVARGPERPKTKFSVAGGATRHSGGEGAGSRRPCPARRRGRGPRRGVGVAGEHDEVGEASARRARCRAAVVGHGVVRRITSPESVSPRTISGAPRRWSPQSVGDPRAGAGPLPRMGWSGGGSAATSTSRWSTTMAWPWPPRGSKPAGNANISRCQCREALGAAHRRPPSTHPRAEGPGDELVGWSVISRGRSRRRPPAAAVRLRSRVAGDRRAGRPRGGDLRRGGKDHVVHRPSEDGQAGLGGDRPHQWERQAPSVHGQHLVDEARPYRGRCRGSAHHLPRARANDWAGGRAHPTPPSARRLRARRRDHRRS